MVLTAGHLAIGDGARGVKRGAAERLAGDLIGTPFVSARDVAQAYGISRRASISVVKTLVALGLLEATDLRTRHGAVRYVAPQVMQILLS